MLIVLPVEDLPLPKFPPTAEFFREKLAAYLAENASKGIRLKGLVEKRINKTRFTVAVMSQGEPIAVTVLLSRSAGINNYPTSERRLAESVELAFTDLAKQGFEYCCTWNKSVGSAVESFYVFYRPTIVPTTKRTKNEVLSPSA